MKLLFIATFPAKHYDLYGNNFLKQADEVLNSLNESSDCNARMEVSIDNLTLLPRDLLSDFQNITLIDYLPSLYDRDKFIEGVTVADESHLDIAGDVAKQIIRWSFKGMMQIYYLKREKQNYDRIIYIDADTKFTKTLNFDDVAKFLPNSDEVLSAVFRHDIQKYTETGWIAWNTTNEHFSNWLGYYEKGWNEHIYSALGQFHDCAIFDWACSKVNAAKYKNLSGGGDHGFNAGILGEFIDHKKGIRKHLGFSYENIPGMNTKVGNLLYKICFGVYIRLIKNNSKHD